MFFSNWLSSYRKGKQGEALALQYLRAQGWKILETNYRAKYGEVDIIALDGMDLVFVEVKSGKKNVYELAEKVDKKKCKRLERTATIFMQKKSLDYTRIRLDVISISIVTGEIHHFREENF